MASLTETAYISRKAINLGVILLIVGIILKIAIENGIAYYQKLFPAPPPPPNYAFGKLPYPQAQNNLATPSGVTYSLQTVDGNLPALPDQYRVYFMPPPASFFGSFEKMRAKATALGFTDIPKRINATSWHFVDPNANLRTLDIDELSGNYRIVYDWRSDPSVFGQKNFTSNDQVIGDAKGILSTGSELPADLKKGKASITYLQYDSGTLVPTTSLSNSDAVAVTFNRIEIDKTPVVSPDQKQGLVSVLLTSNSDPKKKVLEVRYLYNAINLDNYGTYPLIKATDAYNFLKNGNAVYANLPTPVPSPVVIRDIHVAYLDPYPPQSYLQPVLVFTDQANFTAYVPLVSRDWLVSSL